MTLWVQCRTLTYFYTIESVWAPKKWAQIFKNFTNFSNFNQFNNCPFFSTNYFITLLVWDRKAAKPSRNFCRPVCLTVCSPTLLLKSRSPYIYRYAQKISAYSTRVGGTTLPRLLAVVVMVAEIYFQLLKMIPDALTSIRHYCLSVKAMAWKHTANHINNSDPGHTRSKQQLEKNLKITFASLSKKAVEKNKQKKIMAIAKLFALHANVKKYSSLEINMCHFIVSWKRCFNSLIYLSTSFVRFTPRTTHRIFVCFLKQVDRRPIKTKKQTKTTNK